jgi:hypothetical protein
MDNRSLKPLRICAVILGWILLIGEWAGIWGRCNLYRRVQNNPEGFITAIAQFDILSAVSSFFSGFGGVFFAFLIAAVFRMIEKEAPVGKENAQRLMIVCCFSYIAEALVLFYSFILKLSEGMQIVSASGWRSWIPYASTAASPLVPVLYAASIFVLYTHFTKLATFESEVA